MTSRAELRRNIKYYENKTGKLDWQPREVAVWLMDKGVTMPTPQTPLEMLTQQIARVAGRELHRDADSAFEHRVYLAYRAEVDGENKMLWVDANSPTLTQEKYEAARHLRREQALNILVRIAADDQHAQKRHPGWQLSPLDPNMAEEVMWRLGSDGDEGEATKLG